MRVVFLVAGGKDSVFDEEGFLFHTFYPIAPVITVQVLGSSFQYPAFPGAVIIKDVIADHGFGAGRSLVCKDGLSDPENSVDFGLCRIGEEGVLGAAGCHKVVIPINLDPGGA